jgi:translocation and assembly module TamB
MDARAKDLGRPSRFRRFGRIILRVALALVLFVVALPPALLFALRFEGPRAFAARKVDALLATTFRGRLHLASLERVDLGGARVTGSVDDPAGRRVVRFQSVTVDLNVPALLYRVVRDGGSPSVITLDEVAIPHAEIALLDDGSGGPSLAHTFDPRTPSPPGTPSSPTPTVKIARLRIDHVWLHGQLGASPLIDADLARVRAALGLEKDLFHVEVQEGRVAARLEPYALNPRGAVTAALRVPLGTQPLAVRGSFKGVAADAPLEAHASMEGERLSADAVIDKLEQRTVGRFAPDLALRGSLRVAARAEGTLDDLAVTLEAAGEAVGEVAVRGKLHAGEPLRLSADVDGKRLDASAVVPSAPPTRADVDASVTLVSDKDALTGRYEVALQQPQVSGERLPTINAQGSLRSAGSTLDLDGDARVAEAGVRLGATYAVRLANEKGSVEASMEAELADPPRLVKLANARARGHVNVRGRVQFPEPSVSARAVVHLDRVESGEQRLETTRARLEVDGPLSAPVLHGSISVDRAHAGGRDFSNVLALFSGSTEQARINLALSGPKDLRLLAATELRAAGPEIVLTGTTARLHDREGSVDLSVQRAAFGGGRVRLDDVALRGPGSAHASLSMDGARVRVTGQTEGLELVRLASLAGVSTPLRGARASLKFELDRSRDTRASVSGELDRISYGSVEAGKLHLDLALDHDAVSGNVDSELVPGAHLIVNLRDLNVQRLAARNAELPEGEVQAHGRLALGCMAPLIAAMPSVPVENAHGNVDIDLDYRRASLDALPTLTGRIRTHDLELVEKRDVRPEIGSGEEAIQAAPSVIRGIDFGLDLSLDAPSRKLHARLGFYDDRAELLGIDAAAGPWPTGPIAAIAERLRTVPLEVRASMPARKLATLPQPVRPLSLRGTVAGDLLFDGTLDEPHLVVDVRASRLATASERVQGEVKPRLSVVGHVEYKKAGGTLQVVADAKRTRALDATVNWTGDLVRAATDEAARKGFAVNGGATLDDLDLESIPALKNRQIEGILSGTARVEYGPTKRHVYADIAAHPLRAGQATLDRVNVKVDAAPGGVRAAVSSDGRGGKLEASVTSGLNWPAQAVPSLAGDIVAKLSARGFRLAGLWPVVSSSVNELDGKLDADLGARVSGGNVTLSGNGRISDGVVQIPTIGQRFEGISAQIKVAPAAIVIDDLSARGVTGGLKGNARVELDEHLALRQLNASIKIDKDRKLPVTVEGAAVGDAWGRVEAQLVNHPEKVEVRVRVPELHIDVPDSGGDGVQDLAPDERIRVGVHRADAVFTALPIQPLEQPKDNPTPVDINVELGSVWVRKGDMVNAELTGNVHVASGETSVITGRIDLKGGTLDVSGKRFEIERGTVTFTGGDPANPTVSALARWDAPAGYAVYASYTGTAKKGNLTLRAEPPLSQDEIINLILFGTPEGSVSSGSGDTATGAVGLAGSTAARGINRAISDLTKLDIQARVDTSTGVARPELMIPVTKRLSARVTRAIGEPTPGSSPDRTFLTLELRLKRNWALSALLGDRGASALDLIWRKHY